MIELRYFELSEFKCREGQPYPDENDLYSKGLCPLMLMFCDEIRHRCGFPLLVTSGFRNEAYNAKIGGTKNSFHIQGCAADLIVADFKLENFKKLYEAALDVCPRGLGYYPKRRFIHVDSRKNWPSLARWEIKT